MLMPQLRVDTMPTSVSVIKVGDYEYTKHPVTKEWSYRYGSSTIIWVPVRGALASAFIALLEAVAARG